MGVVQLARWRSFGIAMLLSSVIGYTIAGGDSVQTQGRGNMVNREATERNYVGMSQEKVLKLIGPPTRTIGCRSYYRVREKLGATEAPGMPEFLGLQYSADRVSSVTIVGIRELWSLQDALDQSTATTSRLR